MILDLALSLVILSGHLLGAGVQSAIGGDRNPCSEGLRLLPSDSKEEGVPLQMKGRDVVIIGGGVRCKGSKDPPEIGISKISHTHAEEAVQEDLPIRLSETQ